LFAAGNRGPIAAHVGTYNATLAERAVRDWQATLDALDGADGVPHGAVGLYGASMGGAVGVPLVAVDSRIRAAVVGLVGSESVREAASQITVPVQFLMQWNDELVPRESSLAVFDAFASEEKSLHANRGGHRDLPLFEVDNSELFFRRHLTPAQSA